MMMNDDEELPTIVQVRLDQNIDEEENGELLKEIQWSIDTHRHVIPSTDILDRTTSNEKQSKGFSSLIVLRWKCPFENICPIDEHFSVSFEHRSKRRKIFDHIEMKRITSSTNFESTDEKKKKRKESFFRKEFPIDHAAENGQFNENNRY